MQHLGRPPLLTARRCRQQRGQATAEYLVVTAVLMGFLIAWLVDEHSLRDTLVGSFKSFFSAYSFTLSLP